MFEKLKFILDEKLDFIHKNNVDFKYYFIDLPIQYKKPIEDCGLDFTKSCVLDGEMDNVLDDLNVSQIINYCGKYFLLRYYPSKQSKV